MYHYSRVIAQQQEEAREGAWRFPWPSTAHYFATRLLVEFSRRYELTTFNLDVANRISLLNRH